jgi:hypothetical protein
MAHRPVPSCLTTGGTRGDATVWGFCRFLPTAWSRYRGFLATETGHTTSAPRTKPSGGTHALIGCFRRITFALAPRMFSRFGHGDRSTTLAFLVVEWLWIFSTGSDCHWFSVVVCPQFPIMAAWSTKDSLPFHRPKNRTLPEVLPDRHHHHPDRYSIGPSIPPSPISNQ